MLIGTLHLAALAIVVAAIGGQAMAAEKLKMSTISPGSSAYMVMATMASVVNRSQEDYEIVVDATGTATKHQVEAAEGKIDIYMTSPADFAFMQAGTAMYAKLDRAPQLSDNLSLLFWFPYGSYHFITHADSGIETLADLRGKKVFLGPPGGGARVTAASWVEATTGLEAGRDFESVRASWTSGLQAFQDRQIDVYVNGGIPPDPQVMQLALTSRLRILGLDQAQAARAGTVPPAAELGRQVAAIPKGVYGDGVVNGTDVYTLRSTVGVAVRKDLPEKAVYTVLKAFWENIDEARKTAPFMAQVTLDDLGAATNMPLHPGARRYYEESRIAIPKGMK